MKEKVKVKLEVLEKLLVKMYTDLLDIGLEVIDGKYSEYPIFVVHEGNVDIGQLLLDAAEYKLPYTFNLSTLEEFQEEGIIFDDKTESFKTAFGDPKKILSLFWVFDDEAGFIFYPTKTSAERATDKN